MNGIRAFIRGDLKLGMVSQAYNPSKSEGRE
jgi:hypothetical protein